MKTGTEKSQFDIARARLESEGVQDPEAPGARFGSALT